MSEQFTSKASPSTPLAAPSPHTNPWQTANPLRGSSALVAEALIMAHGENTLFLT